MCIPLNPYPEFTAKVHCKSKRPWWGKIYVHSRRRLLSLTIIIVASNYTIYTIVASNFISSVYKSNYTILSNFNNNQLIKRNLHLSKLILKKTPSKGGGVRYRSMICKYLEYSSSDLVWLFYCELYFVSGDCIVKFIERSSPFQAEWCKVKSVFCSIFIEISSFIFI